MEHTDGGHDWKGRWFCLLSRHPDKGTANQLRKTSTRQGSQTQGMDGDKRRRHKSYDTPSTTTCQHVLERKLQKQNNLRTGNNYLTMFICTALHLPRPTTKKNTSTTPKPPGLRFQDSRLLAFHGSRTPWNSGTPAKHQNLEG